jgi:hypothetical protein
VLSDAGDGGDPALATKRKTREAPSLAKKRKTGIGRILESSEVREHENISPAEILRFHFKAIYD